jgi:ATP-binding cassette subfamily C protein LapB
MTSFRVASASPSIKEKPDADVRDDDRAGEARDTSPHLNTPNPDEAIGAHEDMDASAEAKPRARSWLRRSFMARPVHSGADAEAPVAIETLSHDEPVQWAAASDDTASPEAALPEADAPLSQEPQDPAPAPDVSMWQEAAQAPFATSERTDESPALMANESSPTAGTAGAIAKAGVLSRLGRFLMAKQPLAPEPVAGAVIQRVHVGTGAPPASAPDLARFKTRDTLLVSIERMAEAWSGRSWLGGKAVGSSGVPTPEELIGFAAARGIDVTFAERTLASLGGTDFPCAIIDGAGGSIILIERTADIDFICKTDEGLVEKTVAELQDGFTGTVFFIRPQRDAFALDTATPPEYLAPKHRGLIGSILHEVRLHHKRDLAQLALAAGVSNLLLFAMPMFSMAVYDRVIPHLAMETLWALAIGITLALGVDVGLRAARLRLNDAISLSVTSTLQARYFARILRARSGTIPTLGGSLQVGLREIESVSQLLPNLMVSLVIDLPFFIIATVLLFALAGPIAIVPWAASMLAMGLQIFADFSNSRVRESTRLTTTQFNILVETAAARETVQTLNAGPQLLRRWERLTDATAFAGHLNRLQSSLANIAALAISQAAIVGTIIVGVYQIGAGAMTIGALSASTLLIGRMMSPMSQLGMYLHRLKQVRGSVAIVENVLSAKLEAAGDPMSQTRALGGLMELRNVSFTYPGEKNTVLSNISLTIKPGERVGVIGRAGSGKSSLLKLLVRLNEIDSGSFLLDGHDARQYSPEQIRRHFAYMRQDSVPFDDTLRNVICFGLDHVGEDAFHRAVMVSGVHEFASRHPSGYAMRVGPRGERLSGGERQSVMLARILLGESPAMLLDEGHGQSVKRVFLHASIDLAGLFRLSALFGERVEINRNGDIHVEEDRFHQRSDDLAQRIGIAAHALDQRSLAVGDDRLDELLGDQRIAANVPAGLEADAGMRFANGQHGLFIIRVEARGCE